MASHVCRSRAGADRHRPLYQQRLRSRDRGRISSAPPETQPAPAGPRTGTRKAALERKSMHVTGRRKQLASFLGRPDAKFFVKKGDEQKNAKKQTERILWKLTPLMEIRTKRGFPPRRDKTAAHTP